jgi:hypothetical protein
MVSPFLFLTIKHKCLQRDIPISMKAYSLKTRKNSPIAVPSFLEVYGTKMSLKLYKNEYIKRIK